MTTNPQTWPNTLYWEGAPVLQPRILTNPTEREDAIQLSTGS